MFKKLLILGLIFCSFQVSAQTVTKGLIGKQDIHNWDGKTQTFTRTSSTGYPLTLNDLDWIGVDVCQVYGGGVNRTSTSLSAAITAIGTTEKTELYLSKGAWTVTGNVSIPANYTLHFAQGAYLNGAFTLAFAGSPDSQIKALPGQQIFGASLTVTFAVGGLEIYPEWWGIDGTADDVQINKAIIAAMSCGSPVRLMGKKYNTTSPIGYTGALASRIALPSIIGTKSTGVEPYSGTIEGTEISYTGTGNAVSFYPSSNSFSGGVLSDITIKKNGSQAPTDGSKGLYMKECHNFRMYNVTILHFNTGFHSDYAYGWASYGLTSMQNTVGVLLSDNTNAVGLFGSQVHQNTVNLKIEGGDNITISNITAEGSGSTGIVITSDGTTPISQNIKISGVYLENNDNNILIGVDENGVTSPNTVGRVIIENLAVYSSTYPPILELDNVNGVTLQDFSWGGVNPVYTTTLLTNNVKIEGEALYTSLVNDRYAVERRINYNNNMNIFPNGFFSLPFLNGIINNGYTVTDDTTTYAGETVKKIAVPTATVNQVIGVNVKILPHMVGKVLKSCITAQMDIVNLAVLRAYTPVGDAIVGSTVAISTADLVSNTSHWVVPDEDYISVVLLLNNTSGSTKYVYLKSIVINEGNALEGPLVPGPLDYLVGLSGGVNATTGGVDVALAGWPDGSFRVLLTPRSNITAYVTLAANKFTVTTVGGDGVVDYLIIPTGGILH